MAQQLLTVVEREKASIKVQAAAPDKGSEAKATDVARITVEARVAEREVKKLQRGRSSLRATP